MTRNERLLGPINRSMRIIEIGPAFAPTAPKADGWNVCSIDHISRDDLAAKYTGHAGVDVSRIEEVDFVWTSGPLSSAVPERLHGSFQALIASHVIEHAPDLLAFLDSAADLLTVDGVVALAIPDKRYCFDYFKPLTLTGDVLAAHDPSRSRHSRGNAFNEVAYAAVANGSIAWTQEPIRELGLVHQLAEARDFFNALSNPENDRYYDMHAWRFTPSSFALVMLELAWLEKTDWSVDQFTAASGCEFLAWLRRGGRARALSLSDQELAARRLSLLKQMLLETQEQVDFFSGDYPRRTCATSRSPAPAPPPGPPSAPATSSEPPAEASLAGTNSYFVDWFPRTANVFRIFEGEWTSALPGFSAGGAARLFEDGRIPWFEEKIGTFAGKRVLELGPLEGSHTMMMTHRGAQVLAIEANQRAFLRCLAVKEAYGLTNAQFLLGDFVKYLESSPPRFDFVLASGVLYHMLDPVGFLQALAASANTLGLWTHYFDAEAFMENGAIPRNFTLQPRRVKVGTLDIELYDQKYLEALKWVGFCGGMRSGSAWMTRSGIIEVLEDAGFVVEIGVEEPRHPHGPAFCVFARRRILNQEAQRIIPTGATLIAQKKIDSVCGELWTPVDVARLQAEIVALRSSRSWRVTAPLRQFHRIWQRLAASHRSVAGSGDV